MTSVLHLFRCLRHRLPMEVLGEARAIEDQGLEGCAHGRSGSPRQVLLMDMETLSDLRLAPGIIKENITTQGLNLQALPRGQRLRVGEAILEVTLACEPCKLMDDIRPGLQQQLRGRRGQLCRVVQSGRIRLSDPIELLSLERGGTPRGRSGFLFHR
jgi:MOSC domain-containing protein YiiM